MRGVAKKTLEDCPQLVLASKSAALEQDDVFDMRDPGKKIDQCVDAF